MKPLSKVVETALHKIASLNDKPLMWLDEYCYSGVGVSSPNNEKTAVQIQARQAQHQHAVNQAINQQLHQRQTRAMSNMISNNSGALPPGYMLPSQQPGYNQLSPQQPLAGGLGYGNWESYSEIHSSTINPPSSPGQFSSNTSAQLQAIGNALYNTGTIGTAGWETIQRPSKPIENAGIKIGEITAYRMWMIRGDYLEAYSAERIWAPDEPMYAEPSFAEYSSDGIWAFKEKSRAIKKMIQSGYCAYGSVHMWGKIIEHELGYRAEYAQIMSIDDINLRGTTNEKATVIHRLQTKYGVVPPK